MKEQILLKNISVFDVKTGIFRNNLDILIENCLIKVVGKVNYVGKERLSQIDCSGKFAVPGLFECHAHLTSLSFTTKDEEAKKQMLKEFITKGITQIRDAGGPLKTLKKMKEDILNGEFLGPEIFYAGPMLEKSPLHWDDLLPENWTNLKESPLGSRVAQGGQKCEENSSVRSRS